MHALALLLIATRLSASPGDESATIDAAIASMSDREQIAQLLLVAFQGTAMSNDVRMIAGTWRVGGFVFYGPNIESVEQTSRLTTAIRRAAGDDWQVPLFAVDQEGGTVVRLHGNEPIPSAAAIGAAASTELARRAGFTIAARLREAGFTVNLAPVLDINAGPNDSLDRRRFSSDPEQVASLASAFIAGHRDAGIVAVAKHFPGHGESGDDAHATLPRNAASATTLWQRDLLPFRRVIADGAEAILTAHIRVPALDGNVPASLSTRVITNLLRGDLGFDGVVISDEIRMKALTTSTSPAEAAIESLRAGADMILVASLPQERREIFDALVTAHQSGRLPRERIHSALRRILRLKRRIAERATLQPAQRDHAVFGQIASRAVTVIDPSHLLPIARDSAEKILYVGPRAHFPPALHRATTVLWGNDGPSAEHMQQIREQLRRSPALIVATGETSADLRVAQQIHEDAPDLRLVLLWCGDPWKLSNGPDPNALILTYGRHPAAIDRATTLLLGR